MRVNGMKKIFLAVLLLGFSQANYVGADPRWGQQNKGVESTTDFQKIARSISRWYDKECEKKWFERRRTWKINSIMTSWRRQSVQYGDKNYLKNLAAALNATGHTVLADLMAKSVIPPDGNLVINPNGSTSPEYTRRMCPGDT